MDSRIYILTHKRLTGQLSSTENSELARLSLIPEYKSLSDEIAYLWNISNNYFPKKDWNKDAAKEAFYEKIRAPKAVAVPAPEPLAQVIPQTTSINWKYIIGGAAALLLLTWGIFKFATSEKVQITAQEKIEYANLNDDTKVWLDQGATLTIIEESETSRKVALEGEAFFDVSHDPQRPFIIDLGNDVYAQVLGTSFKARSTHEGDNGKISVRDGSVRLYSSKHEGYDITLIAGEEGELNPQDNINTKSYSSSIEGLMSGEQEIVFIDQPIEQLLEKLGLHFGVEFISDQKSKLDCPYTASIPRGTSLDEILGSMSSLYPNISFSEADRSTITIEGICEEVE